MPRSVLLMISSMRGGGSERQTLLLLRHLDRSRFTPHLYLTERAGELLSQVPDDVPVHSFADAGSTAGVYFPGRVLGKQIRHLREVIDRESLELIYDRTFHMTMIAGPAAKSLGVPRVSTIVSPPHLALPLVEKRFLWLKRRRLANAYKQAQSVVAVSRQAARSAEDYYCLPSDWVKVIANPVDLESVCQAARASAPNRDERLTIVCVGRMTEEKGHRDLLSAIALTDSRWPERLPAIRLWLIGDGPLRGELERQWESTSSRHRVDFLGIQENAAPEIAAADALVLPSHFEGMPNVVLEAMALGTPVIATSAGGTVELERDEATILWAQPGKPDSLADAILRFATDRAAGDERAKAASRLVQQYHDVRVTTRTIEQLLESGLSN